MKITKYNPNQLKLEVKPFTAWFFSFAQFVVGLCFLHVYTTPGSSKTLSLILSVFLLGLSIWSFWTSFTSYVLLDKRSNKIYLFKFNLFWKDKEEFKISDISDIALNKYSLARKGEVWEIEITLFNQTIISLFPPSTNVKKYKKAADTIRVFLS